MPSDCTVDAGRHRAASASRREMAVTRSLDPARVRAERRVQSIIDAALELLSDPDTKNFTVQQVVESSGQSLRSFYQHFAGKYELLLAVFEEAMGLIAGHLSTSVAASEDPIERLRIFVFEFFDICKPPVGRRLQVARLNPATVAEFAQQLLSDHPSEASAAFEPVIGLLVNLLDEAVAVGAIRDDIDHRRIAGMVVHSILFTPFSTTISGLPLEGLTADPLWQLTHDGLTVR